jgi:hypothetical protein
MQSYFFISSDERLPHVVKEKHEVILPAIRSIHLYNQGISHVVPNLFNSQNHNPDIYLDHCFNVILSMFGNANITVRHCKYLSNTTSANMFAEYKGTYVIEDCKCAIKSHRVHNAWWIFLKRKKAEDMSLSIKQIADMWASLSAYNKK